MRTPKTVFIKPRDKKIDIYLKDDAGNVYYLCTQKSYESIIRYFGAGRSWNNLKKGFGKFPGRHVYNVVEKIQKQAKYVMKYEGE